MLKPCSLGEFTISGWWCNNHLEKYEAMGRIIPCIMENKKNVPNHQPAV